MLGGGGWGRQRAAISQEQNQLTVSGGDSLARVQKGDNLSLSVARGGVGGGLSRPSPRLKPPPLSDRKFRSLLTRRGGEPGNAGREQRRHRHCLGHLSRPFPPPPVAAAPGEARSLSALRAEFPFSRPPQPRGPTPAAAAAPPGKRNFYHSGPRGGVPAWSRLTQARSVPRTPAAPRLARNWPRLGRGQGATLRRSLPGTAFLRLSV